MDEIVTIAALRARLAPHRLAGRRIALVPTMGFLHDGHLRLVDAARREADVVVMTLFVNPLQFAPNEDFDRYPRDLPRDRTLAAGRGVDVLFAPTPGEMYLPRAELRITGAGAADRWEGAVRPGHFDGVLTVVAKLFNIVAPDIACFGQKDVQQATLIRRMIRELNFPIRLVVVPTCREPDGLAMSSRNVYLSAADRVAALAISRGLATAEASWRRGERDAQVLRDVVAKTLAAGGLAADYIAIVDPDDLAPVASVAPGTVIALAVRVGATRLIDNIILGDGHEPHDR